LEKRFTQDAGGCPNTVEQDEHSATRSPARWTVCPRAHGRHDDFLDQAGEVDQDVQDWSRGRFRLRGTELAVTWLDEPESRHVRDDTFGLGTRQTELPDLGK